MGGWGIIVDLLLVVPDIGVQHIYAVAATAETMLVAT
mgnify:FL=1